MAGTQTQQGAGARWEFVNLRQAGAGRAQAVLRLAQTQVDRGRRVLVRVSGAAEARDLDRDLWTVRPDSFLPHAAAGGADQAEEPVLIVSGEANPNQAQVLVLLHPPQDEPAGFELVQVLIPPEDGPELDACRELYRDMSHRPGVEVAHLTSLP